MAKIRIATDSTSDIPAQLREELNIAVLPVTLIVGDKEYKDGYDLTPQEFYEMLESASELPTTSRVVPTLYTELYEESWEAASKRVKASAESIYEALFDDEFFIG